MSTSSFVTTVLILFSCLISAAEKPLLLDMRRQEPPKIEDLTIRPPKEIPTKLLIDPAKQDATPYFLKPRQKKILNGPDVTAGANPFEQDLNEVLELLKKGFKEHLPESADFLEKIQIVIVPPETDVEGPQLRWTDFIGQRNVVSYSLSESQVFFFFYTELLPEGHTVLRSEIYSELIRLVTETQYGSSNHELDRVKQKLKDFVRVPFFLDWNNTARWSSPNSTCRNLAQISAQPGTGRLTLSFNSSGECPEFQVLEPLRNLSPLKVSQGVIDYQCQTQADTSVQCFPVVDSDFSCTTNIWNRIDPDQKPTLFISSLSQIEARFFLCELQKTRPSAKLPLRVILERSGL